MVATTDVALEPVYALSPAAGSGNALSQILTAERRPSQRRKKGGASATSQTHDDVASSQRLQESLPPLPGQETSLEGQNVGSGKSKGRAFSLAPFGFKKGNKAPKREGLSSRGSTATSERTVTPSQLSPKLRADEHDLQVPETASNGEHTDPGGLLSVDAVFASGSSKPPSRPHASSSASSRSSQSSFDHRISLSFLGPAISNGVSSTDQGATAKMNGDGSRSLELGQDARLASSVDPAGTSGRPSMSSSSAHVTDSARTSHINSSPPTSQELTGRPSASSSAGDGVDHASKRKHLPRKSHHLQMPTDGLSAQAAFEHAAAFEGISPGSRGPSESHPPLKARSSFSGLRPPSPGAGDPLKSFRSRSSGNLRMWRKNTAPPAEEKSSSEKAAGPDVERKEPMRGDFANANKGLTPRRPLGSMLRRPSSRRSAVSSEKTPDASEMSSSPTATRPGTAQGGSQLENQGGAAALFGGGPAPGQSGSRSRASSLIPALFTGRARANSGKASRPNSRSGALAPPEAGGQTRSVTSPATTPMPTPPTAGPTSAPATASIPKLPPALGESPHRYAKRVERSVERSDVATVLASNSEEFFMEALRCHMRKFLFVGNPLDIALRKMLMELRLPKETQQIDRVMEAFAKRYNECNEGLFSSEDQPYILAFSLMMLHTDAFNRNAKNKMSKADYVKNTSSSDVPQDILEYLYDNLTFTQFVYSDEADALTTTSGSGSGSSNSGSGGLFTPGKDRNAKVDAYLIIRQGRLSQLCPSIEDLIPEEEPFSASSLDADPASLASAYMMSPSLQIEEVLRPGSSQSDFAGIDASLASIAPPKGTAAGSQSAGSKSVVTVRIFKVGIIHRKADVVEKGKKASKRWKACGMILTSSQLLFFQDMEWIDALRSQIAEQLAAAAPEDRRKGILLNPPVAKFQPDGVLSLADAIALRDDNFDRQQSVFRLVGMQSGAQHEYLFQCRDMDDLFEWIEGINFCACFRSAGLRVSNVDALALQWKGDDEGDVGHAEEGTLRSSGRAASAKVANRRKQLVPKLQQAEQSLSVHLTELQELLRLAKQFAIMTPFQRSTRERIEAAAVPLAARIRQLRILVAKFDKRRAILAAEVGDELTVGSQAGSISMLHDESSDVRDGGQSHESGSNHMGPELSSEGDGYTGEARGLPRKDSVSASTTGSLSASLQPVSEANETNTEGLGPRSSSAVPSMPTFGSFASVYVDAEAGEDSFHSSATGSGSPRSFISKLSRSKSRGALHRSHSDNHGSSRTSRSSEGEGSEAWKTTKAFRDPDRISLAQLPSLETIEAATREKARRRVLNQQHEESKGGLLIYPRKASIPDVPPPPPMAPPMSKSASSNSSGGVGGASSSSQRRGSRSTSASHSSHSGQGRSRAIDPPVFMTAWGT